MHDRTIHVQIADFRYLAVVIVADIQDSYEAETLSVL